MNSRLRKREPFTALGSYQGGPLISESAELTPLQEVKKVQNTAQIDVINALTPKMKHDIEREQECANARLRRN